MLNVATAATYTMPATLPSANDLPDMDNNQQPEAVDSDQDAEGEEETDFYQMDQQLQDAVHRAYSGEVAAEETMEKLPDEGDKDAEGEPDVEAILDGDNEDAEPVGAVKLPDEVAQSSDNEEDADADADADVDIDAEAEADPAFENQKQDDDDSSSSSQPDAEEDWEAESNGHDGGLDNPARGNCM